VSWVKIALGVLHNAVIMTVLCLVIAWYHP
jgi:hypothetical protein